MQIENSLCDYDAVERINREMRKQLQALVQEKYFKFYKVWSFARQTADSSQC